jgi:AcrR family transcriptional regulator
VTVTGFKHGRVPREVRLRHVLELAEALFAEKGYSAASMDELARRAGVSKPVIYELVGSKEELWRACMVVAADELASRVTTAVRSVEGPRERMLAGIEAWFGFVAQHRDVWDGLLSGEDMPAGNVGELRLKQAGLVAELLRAAAAEADGSVVAGPAIAGFGGASGEPASVATAAQTGVGDDVFGALAHVINGACESLSIWWRDHPNVSTRELAELCTSVLFSGLESLAGTGEAAGDS